MPGASCEGHDANHSPRRSNRPMFPQKETLARPRCTTRPNCYYRFPAVGKWAEFGV